MAARAAFGRLGGALLAGALAATGAWGLGRTRPGRAIELKARDALMRATVPALGGHPEVVFILVTEESLDWAVEKHRIGWPWPRDVLGYLFRACARGRAAAVLFDFFTLGDPGEGEEELREAMKGAPPSFLAVPFLRDPPRRAVPWEAVESLLERFALRVEGDGSVDPGEPYRWVKLPRPAIAEAARGVCDVATPRDPADDMVRRYRLFSRFRGRFYPSFALAALMVREGADRVEVRDRTARVGTRTIPLERDGTFRLRYYSPGDSFRVLTASRVLGGLQELEETGRVTTFDPKDLEGKIVIVGTNAPGLYDVKGTPVAEAMPGCEVHGVALANLLRGDWLREVPAAGSLAAALLVGLVVAAVTRLAPAWAGGAASAAVLAGYGAAATALFGAGWIVELVPPLLGGMLSFGAVGAINFLVEGRQRLRVKREFSRYLSPRVVEKILRHPDGLRLEGERKPLTVFFMDFAGFTTLSETMDPAELVKLVSRYHHEAAEEIFRTEGTIDKYIGDAIMAFWNDPVEQPDHALRACRAAVGAQRRLREFAARMRAQGLPEMRARMGINTGIATVGNMGARGQVNYTAIGDEVNLASRLEGVNKEFGTDIIIGEATRAAAGEEVEVRELALIRVKGKRKPVRIYELLGMRGEVAPERVEAARRFERALEAFHGRRFAEALEAFRAARAAGDAAAAPYEELCGRYRAEPPPPDWDGSYQMTTK